MDKFLEESGYNTDFKDKNGDKLNVNSPEFIAKWKELAQDEKFASAQSKHAQKTHYDPVIIYLKNNNMDMQMRGQSVQEAIMSTGNQYGAKRAGKLIIKAFKIYMKKENLSDLTEVSDDKIINAIQDYKFEKVDDHFKSSSPETRNAIKNKRIPDEKKMLLKLYEKEKAERDEKLKLNEQEKRVEPKPKERPSYIFLT